MELISDSELQDIVHKVLQSAMGGNMNSPTKPDRSDPVPSPSTSSVVTQPSTNKGKTIALGADHGGFPLKENIKTEAVDYPDFAYAVAKKVSEGNAWRGIVVDGAGIGSCMVANKVPGVRAAMCYDHATAVNSREHNDANVLTLGAGLIGPNLATQIVQTWLRTEFAGGRHSRRVDKIMAIEKR
jgi:ribose 5-phosphate isomerase B